MIRACAPVLAFFLAGGVLYAQAADASFPKKVAQAIDKGVEWLKNRQIKQGADKGSWGTGENPTYGGGGTSQIRKISPCVLALFTLLSCEVDPEDPVIVDGFDYVLKNLDTAWKEDNVNIDQSKQQADTYTAATLLLAIEALYNARIDKALKAKGTDPKTLKQRPTIKPDGPYKAIVGAATKWLIHKQTKRGGWRYGEPYFPDGPASDLPKGVSEVAAKQDISATQIVLLGLASAVRMGEKVDPNVWVKAATFNIEGQEQDGPPLKVIPKEGEEGKTVLMREGDKSRGWAYYPGSKSPTEGRISGGMTASGICSLIICSAQLQKGGAKKDLLEKIRRGIFDGLAWLQTNWNIQRNPGGSRSHFYYLYGLERVGVLGSMQNIGDHNWYLEGAEFLIGAQKEDGQWNSGTEIEPCDVFDSCFALLFLKKATIPVTLISR